VKSRHSLFACILLFALYLGTGFGCSANASQQAQTDVNQAIHTLDASGIPLLTITDVGTVHHPAWTALYALAYAGVEDYEPSLGVKPDPARFEASIAWLKTHLVQSKHGLWIWPYHFDNTYNDIAITAPWGSAFAQATGIQALLAHWRSTHNAESLELAEKAAESLFVPLQQGGFLFQRDEDVFFEEIPASIDNPSHILNGHLRTLLALDELTQVSNNPRYADMLGKGVETLLRWLPLYDTGYWLRYDLNPRKQELLFRLANPYGFANPELAIDRIVLRDPVSGEEAVLDVGAADDADGALRIAGNDWGQIEQLDGRNVRRLLPVSGQREPEDSEGQMLAPHSYFYLKLPGQWQDNLRRERLELMVEYLDEEPGNLQVQMRSIAPGARTFRELQNGDLLLSGSGQWRQWRIPLYNRDLGFWVGTLYAHKHTEYLQKLAKADSRLLPWAQTALAYQRSAESGERFQVVVSEKIELPVQTPMLPVLSVDEDGVVMQHLSSSDSKFDAQGAYDFLSGKGVPVYSPYAVAVQQGIIDSPAVVFYSGKASDLKKEGQLRWFKSKDNQVEIGEAITYQFNFPNVYNDVATPNPWTSAFSQAYIIKALGLFLEEREDDVEIKNLINRVAYAYEVSTQQGGVSSLDKAGSVYFEEVPNDTHVLNAHLISTLELARIAKKFNDPRIKNLAIAGMETLRNKLWQFDTGYWMRYDLNPKKELLFQIDWLSGDASPLIESINLESPQSARKVVLDTGSDQAFDGASRITGLEWLPVQTVDGKQVRGFSNGYLQHPEIVQGGTRHNVYALMQLPERTFLNYFDVRPHRLVLRYKDVAAGQFVVKIQSINEGNVLDFVPLRNAVITAIGDQQWKDVVIEVRPQDMGWYKGSDYQVYEVEQLQQIAELSGDWFFEQTAVRQGYFLQIKNNGQSVILAPSREMSVELTEMPEKSIALSMLSSSPTYEGFGFENALDGSLTDNYVAGIENEENSYVVLHIENPTDAVELILNWESELNYPGRIIVNVSESEGDVWKEIADVRIESGKETTINLSGMDNVKKIKLIFSDFRGQPRLLMRGIEMHAASVSPVAFMVN